MSDEPNADRLVSSRPVAYRLFKRKDGTIVLQGAYHWQQGSCIGHEWRDLETVEEQQEVELCIGTTVLNKVVIGIVGGNKKYIELEEARKALLLLQSAIKTIEEEQERKSTQ